MIKKPLLAGNLILAQQTYPVICSPKLDGIRCLIVLGRALSRTFLPIPNNHTRNTLEQDFQNSSAVHDGEIIIEGLKFNEISSAIMSEEGEPDFKYIRFDCITNPTDPYYLRIQNLRGNDIVRTDIAQNEEQLLKLEQEYLDLGYEGLMARSHDGIYKEGRSTTKEQILLKLKRFEDSEAEVLGFIEQMKNENVITVNEIGKNKRSVKKGNMAPKNTLGALKVRDVKTGAEFKLSTGFSDELRKEIWQNQCAYLGKLVKFKFQAHGTLNKPRSPVFIGMRSREDI